jgi:hypothetical protein
MNLLFATLAALPLGLLVRRRHVAVAPLGARLRARRPTQRSVPDAVPIA